jgi:cobalamin synthase
MWLFGATGGAPTWLKALLFIPALVSVAALFVLAYMTAGLHGDRLAARAAQWLVRLRPEKEGRDRHMGKP